MADINDIQAAEAVKIVGSNSTGVEQTPVQSTSNGGLHTNLRDSSGTELATKNNPLNIQIGNTGSADAFGRLRISSPDTIFESHFRFSKQTELWTELLANGGTATHTPNLAGVTLGVTTTNGSSAIYQTRRHLPYNAGKSQQIFFTGIFGAGQANTTKRYGYYNSNDGIFFELNDTTKNIVLRSSTSGSIVDTTIAQANWNLDKLDGTGTSGITLDFTKNNLFIIDFAWLGTGRIRIGIVIGGNIIYCHQILNGNVNTAPYMRQGSLPIRAEIFNTNTAASSSTMIIICSTVLSEGGLQVYGVRKSYTTGFTGKTIGTSLTPVLSIRLKSATNQATAKLLLASVLGSQTADDLELVLLVNPTLTGASYSSISDILEADIAATSLTGGMAIYSVFFRSDKSAASDAILDFQNALNVWFGSALNGTSDIFTLAVRVRTGTTTVYGNIHWLEMP